MSLFRGFHLDSRTMALLIIAVAMGIAGRLAFIWLPNVMLSYFIVAVIAITYGPMLGALTGGITMLLSDMVVGFTPLSLFTISGLAIFGLACGIIGRACGLNRRTWSPAHIVFSAAMGAGLVAAYSMFTDIGSTLFFIGGSGDFASKYVMVATAGIVFNLPMMFVNGALFGFVLRPVLDAVNTIDTGEIIHEVPETAV